MIQTLTKHPVCLACHILLFANLGYGQEEAKIEQDPAKSIDVVILLDAPGEGGLAGETYVQKVKAAVGGQAAKDGLSFDSIDIEKKKPSDFNILKQFVAAPEKFKGDAEKQPALEWIEGSKWLVTLDRLNVEFISLKINYIDAKDDTARSVEVLPSDTPLKEGTSQVQMMAVKKSLGEYQLLLPNNWRPTEFSINYREAGKMVPSEDQVWPEKRTNYVLKIGGLRGGADGQKKLFELLADKQQANALEFLGSTRPALFANLHVNEANRGSMSSWRDDVFTIRMPQLGGLQSQSSAAWICFPLTDEGLTNLTKSLSSKMWEPGELIATIKGEKTWKDGKKFRPSKAVKDVIASVVPGPGTTGSGTEMWYEIPVVKNPDGTAMYLERSFRPQKIDEWMKLVQNNSGCKALVIYEGKDNDRPVAQLIKVGGKDSLWEEQGLDHILLGIQKLTQRKQ